MKMYTDFIRHNPGVCLGFVLIPLVLIFAYGCQSLVFSSINPSQKINRQQLVNEVDSFLAAAETKFDDLDRQDLVKNTIFNSVLELAQGKAASPLGVASVIATLVGIGAVGDNIKKRTHIKTLKGGNINVKENQKV